MGKKIAYTVFTEIPQSVIKKITDEIDEYFEDFDTHEVVVKSNGNPAVLALIEKGITKLLKETVNDFYLFDCVREADLSKIFKAEIKEAEAKYDARVKAEKAAYDAQVKAANAGVLRLNPEDVAKATKLLAEAGIQYKN